MKLKKTNAVLGLLSALALLVHVGYTVYAYLAFFYNPTLKLLTAIPLMMLICLHAVCGMCSVFFLADGTKFLMYPKLNRSTLIQRLSAALFFPLLILHLNTFSLLQNCSKGGQWFFFALLLLSQPLFYAVTFTHTAVSISRALITLGLLADRKRQKRLDKIIFIILAILFAVTVFAIVKTELAMFLPTGGQP